MNQLKNKVAIITGASRGIGKTIAQYLANEGVNLALCSRNDVDLNIITDKVKHKENTIKLFHQKVDIAEEIQVQNFINEVIQQFGNVDYLINNAGIYKRDPLIDIPLEDWDKIMNTNLKGTFLFMKYLIPHMKKNQSGHIINIASLASNIAIPETALYCTSKFALKGLSLSAKEELRNYGIKLTIIYPGSVDTDIWNSFEARVQRSKMINPEEIAENLILMLKTGDLITIDELIVNPIEGKLAIKD